METVTDFIFLGSKIRCDQATEHQIKKKKKKKKKNLKPELSE